MMSLIEGPWQLIHCVQKGPTKGSYELLFNLSDDPGAHKDLAAQYPERVQRMSARIASWLASGRAARPELVPTSEETRQLMRDIGYIGDGEDPASDDGHDAEEEEPLESGDEAVPDAEPDRDAIPERACF
jgi:hypothetical protein